MFIEQNITGERRGWIEVVCGSMFSGKTEELIRRLKRAKIANLQVAIYKPATDTRFDVNKVVSHDANYIESIPVKNASKILALSKTADVIVLMKHNFLMQVLLKYVKH